jgi:hypothetical protein
VWVEQNDLLLALMIPACADGLVQLKRAANGEHPIPDLCGLGISQVNEKKRLTGVYSQHCCVMLPAGARLSDGEWLPLSMVRPS